MAKRPRGNSKPKKTAVRPPVIDLKAEETKSAEATASKADAAKDSALSGAKDAAATVKSTTEATKERAAERVASAKGNAEKTAKVETSSPASKVGAAKNGAAKKTADGKPIGGPSKAASSGSGGFSKMMAGGLALLTLAAIALGGWLYRDYGSNIFGSPQASSQAAAVTALEERLAGLEATAKANADKLASLPEASAGAGSNTSELEAMAKANAGKLETLSAGITAVEQKIAALETSIGSQTGAGSDELAAVQKSVAELRTALSSASGQDSGAGQAANKLEIDKLSAGLAEIGDRVGKAEGAIAEAKPADVSGLEGKIAELGERIGKAEGAIAEAKPTDVSGLEGKLAGLETELATLKAEQSQLATQTRSELGEAFAKLSGKVATSDPFEAELDALVTEAPAAPGIDVLRPLALTGVTSIGELADALGNIKIPAAAGGDEAQAASSETSGGGFMDGLKAKLSSVVKIRKLDEADWPAVLTQAAELVRGGQLAQARSLLSGQPGETLEGLADWDKKADVRAKADAAMAVLSKAVLARLAASGTSG